MIIKRITNEEECKLCDEFLSKLNSYEAMYDEVLNGEFKFSELHKNNMDNKYFYIAIAYEDIPVGYVFSYLKTSKGKVHNTNVVEIEALFVEKSYRKKGIGKELVNSVETWAKDNFEDYVIELHAINNNSGSIKFYESLGFNNVRTIFRK